MDFGPDRNSSAFQEESEKLADVIAHIRTESLRLEGQNPGAAHRDASIAIQSILLSSGTFYADIL